MDDDDDDDNEKDEVGAEVEDGLLPNAPDLKKVVLGADGAEVKEPASEPVGAEDDGVGVKEGAAVSAFFVNERAPNFGADGAGAGAEAPVGAPAVELLDEEAVPNVDEKLGAAGCEGSSSFFFPKPNFGAPPPKVEVPPVLNPKAGLDSGALIPLEVIKTIKQKRNIKKVCINHKQFLHHFILGFQRTW